MVNHKISNKNALFFGIDQNLPYLCTTKARESVEQPGGKSVEQPGSKSVEQHGGRSDEQQ